MGRTAPFDVPAGQPLKSGLLFPAKTVIVDNWTNQYLRSPQAGMFVSPYHRAAVLPFDSASGVGEIQWLAPFGFQQRPIVSGEMATTTFTTDDLPYSPGVSARPENVAPSQRLLALMSAQPNSNQQSDILLDSGVIALFCDTLGSGNQAGFTITDLDNNRSITPVQNGYTLLFSGATQNIRIILTAGVGGLATKMAIYEVFSAAVVHTI